MISGFGNGFQKQGFQKLNIGRIGQHQRWIVAAKREKERKLEQPVAVGLVDQVKIGSENIDESFDVAGKIDFVRLSRRHKKHARRLNFVFVAINHMKTGPVHQEKHLKKIVPVRVFHTEMTVGVENFHLKLAGCISRVAEIMHAVHGNLFCNRFILIQTELIFPEIKRFEL